MAAELVLDKSRSGTEEEVEISEGGLLEWSCIHSDQSMRDFLVSGSCCVGNEDFPIVVGGDGFFLVCLSMIREMLSASSGLVLASAHLRRPCRKM